MFPIQEVTDADVAFPALVAHLMPPMDQIPREFQNLNDITKWNKLVHEWFYFGLKELKLTPKPGVDEKKALRHIRCILASFEPKHEHKIAACAFLLSQWFEDVTWTKAERKLV